jgi:hypothetical protein
MNYSNMTLRQFQVLRRMYLYREMKKKWKKIFSSSSKIILHYDILENKIIQGFRRKIW